MANRMSSHNYRSDDSEGSLICASFFIFMFFLIHMVLTFNLVGFMCVTKMVQIRKFNNIFYETDLTVRELQHGILT